MNLDARTSAIELRHSIAGARRPASIDAGVAGSAIGTFAARAAFAVRG
ncbi:hypothetical protein [Burkholderia pseudomallei]